MRIPSSNSLNYLQNVLDDNTNDIYTYGSLGELKEVSLPSGDIITYKHNANNQRVAKLKNGEVVEKYLWLNLTTLLAIYDKNDQLVQRFEYADGRMPLSYTDSSRNIYYIAYNQIGSPRAIMDETGNIIKTLSYDSFGTILHDSNPALRIPFGFAGGLYDPGTKLTRFGYRDYDASTGKWTAKDPIGFDGGDTNLYGYVLGDPVNLVDPSGLVDVTPLPSGIDPSDVPAPVRPWTDPYTVPGTRNINATVRPFGRSNPIPDPENPKDTLPNIEVGICIEIPLP